MPGRPALIYIVSDEPPLLGLGDGRLQFGLLATPGALAVGQCEQFERFGYLVTWNLVESSEGPRYDRRPMRSPPACGWSLSPTAWLEHDPSTLDRPRYGHP
jgi:hypothetical protein